MSSLNGKLIFNKFRTKKLIAKTYFGWVYEGINEKDNESIAIKFEKIKSTHPCLESEAFILFNIKGFGIPKFISYGKKSYYNILIEELLGSNIGKIWNMKNSNLNHKLKNICMIALQVLDRLEYIHSKNIIHRDIKTNNLSIGRKNPEVIYIIDFGLATKYRSSRTGKHIKFTNMNKAIGSLEYLSINGNKGYQQSRRDDLESLGYMVIFLAKNSLPWMNKDIAKIKKNIIKFKKVAKLKVSITLDKLCEGLPEEITQYIKYCRNLEFEQDPNYNYLRNLFKRILFIYNQKNDLNFFWNFKKNLKIESERKSSDNRVNFFKRRENSHQRLYKQIKNSLEKAKSQDLLNSFKILRLNNFDNKNYSDKKLYNKTEKNKTNRNDYKIIINKKVIKKNFNKTNIYKKKIFEHFSKKKLTHKKINTSTNIKDNYKLETDNIGSEFTFKCYSSKPLNKENTELDIFNNNSNRNFKIKNIKIINEFLDKNIFKSKGKIIYNRNMKNINITSIQNNKLIDLKKKKKINIYRTLEERNKIKKKNKYKQINITKLDNNNKINNINTFNPNNQNENNSKKQNKINLKILENNINNIINDDANEKSIRKNSYEFKIFNIFENKNNIYNQNIKKLNSKNEYIKFNLLKKNNIQKPHIKHFSENFNNESNYSLYNNSNINRNDRIYMNNKNNNIFVLPKHLNFSLNLNGLKYKSKFNFDKNYNFDYHII